MTDQTNRIEMLVRLRSVTDLTGFSLRIRPQDQVLKVSIEHDSVVVLIRRIKMKQTYTETRYLSADLELSGLRLISGIWISSDTTVVPDASFVPSVTLDRGAAVSPTEARSRLLHEAACHRPGNDSRVGQRDSYARIRQADSPMASDWSGHHSVWSSS